MNAPEALNVRIHGKHEPTLVFVHGFACTQEDWAAQVKGLSARFRCVTLDLPGHGASAPPPQQHQATIAALASVVNDARRHSGARQVILIGHSLGCKVIRDAYAESSDGVAGMVFIEGAFYEADRETLMQRAVEAIDSAGFAAYAERHFAAMFVEGSDRAVRARVLAQAGRLDPAFGRALYLDAVGWDPLRGKETLRRIAVPALVLQSTHVDSHFQRVPMQPGMRTSFTDAVTSLVAQSQVQVITGVGHFPQIEAADEVNRAIEEFALRVAKCKA